MDDDVVLEETDELGGVNGAVESEGDWEHYDAEEGGVRGELGRAGCVEAAIECVENNADTISRYLRGSAQDLLGLAEEWREGLEAGEADSLFDDVCNALEDMLDSAQHFANRKGWGAKTIRARAEGDVLAITRVLVMFEREKGQDG